MSAETKPTIKRKQPKIAINPSQVREAIATGNTSALVWLIVLILSAIAVFYAGGTLVIDDPAEPPAVVEPAE